MKIRKMLQQALPLHGFEQLLGFSKDLEQARIRYEQCVFGPQIEQFGVQDDKNELIAIFVIKRAQNGIEVKFAFIVHGADKTAVMKQLDEYVSAKRYRQVSVALDETWDNKVLRDMGFEQVDQRFVKIYQYPIYLVFGGGGAHGAFQTGVFDALKAAEIVPQGIIGVSVGAITGMSLQHLDSTTAHEVWGMLTTQKVYGTDEIGKTQSEFAQTMARQLVTRDYKSKDQLFDLFLPVAQKELVNPIVKFSLITTETTGLLQKIVTVDKDMTPEELTQWVVASSAFFPVVEPVEIDGKRYMDGGYSNDLPIQVAIEQGAKEIYAVDIQGLGRIRAVDLPSDVVLHQIETKWDLGPLLDFSPTQSEFNMRLGWLETQKLLGKLYGLRYTFAWQPDYAQVSWDNLSALFATTELTMQMQGLLGSEAVRLAYQRLLERFVGQSLTTDAQKGLATLELIADYLKLAPGKVYHPDYFIDILTSRFEHQRDLSAFNLPEGEISLAYAVLHPETILAGVFYTLMHSQLEK
ncbi:hypothetical protein EQG49_10210 [Periweissella cryptocerci]|uniref:PNPLA domain-containing protein n=1 Tax=Periweissella cryptocerci TaxID=2506420 RepID=A0A4P6YVE1_9LACO|nr:patatin-like phospholipase family protein [Periweissella cryptocerci]QBO36809.1 hypothetical protein EQG49_10210 [Periweissella cryptocerci]